MGAANNNISVTHDNTANAAAAQHPAAPPPEKQDFVVKNAQGERVNAPTQSGAGVFYPVAGAHTSQKPVRRFLVDRNSNFELMMTRLAMSLVVERRLDPSEVRRVELACD